MPSVEAGVVNGEQEEAECADHSDSEKVSEPEEKDTEQKENETEQVRGGRQVAGCAGRPVRDIGCR